MDKRSLGWREVQFVDTHCHLDFETYNEDIGDVISRASNAGVTHIIVPGINLSSSLAAVKLAERFSRVYAAVGVHPGYVDTWSLDQLGEFKALLEHEKVVGVGEIGLDFHHRQDNLSKQTDMLKIFLTLAIECNKPVILHSRDCLHELIQIIEQHNSRTPNQLLRGVFHAFEGNLKQADYLSSEGFFLGVGGPITYKNAAIKQEVFSKIDLSQILLETDGPFLSPQENRGKRNESAWIPIIAKKVAELRHCDIKEVSQETTRNAKILFNWNE